MDPVGIIELLTKFGGAGGAALTTALAVIFGWLYTTERKARIEAEKRERLQSKVLYRALNRTTNALRTFQSVVYRGILPSPADFELEDPDELVDEHDG
jgi:hypothetical protein